MTRRPGKNNRSAPAQSGLFPGEGGPIIGMVERIRFRAEDTGYTVLLLQPDGKLPAVTAVGPLSALREGERVHLEGDWKEHPRFGRQFQVRSFQPLAPTTAEGIEKFLASGAIKRIGPALAGRIVARFGEESLDVLDTDPRRLLDVPGLGEKTLEDIIESWKSLSEVKEVMLYLQQYDIPLHLSEKIFRAYGTEAIPILREDPYRLATDIYGVGFRTADRIARQIGLPADAPQRIEAGLLYILTQQAESSGHVFLPYDTLAAEAAEMLEVSGELVSAAIEKQGRIGGITVENASGGESEGTAAIYAPPLYAAETEAARRLRALQETARDGKRLAAALRGRGVAGGDAQERLSNFARQAIAGGQATGDQARAIESALTEKVLIVTGGPGTGKTTVINAVTRLYQQLGLSVLLAAPTGRAAKRLAEVTGHEARTIHRLLEYNWASGGFTRDAERPLEADALVIDEASMLDIQLTAHLLRAVPDQAVLVLVGDVDQLPSVGPGTVLRDIIESGAMPVVRLKEVFRQAKESLIVENAHRVNQGELPRGGKPAAGGELLDFYFIEESDPEACADTIVTLCQGRIPQRFGLDPIADVQVISPMQRGILGVQNLNARLQEALNPATGGPVLRGGGRTFRPGDKLIQVRNNYEKNVFNGDIGIVRQIDPEAGALRIAFDGLEVEHTAGSLDEVMHAYAITVHKSQGSEYPAVVVPLHTQHYPMLQRNLIYTALTRARQLAVFVGTKKAVAIAVKNAQVRRRWSRLSERLRGGAPPGPGPAPSPPEEKAAPQAREAAWDDRPPDEAYAGDAWDDDGGADASGELTYHPLEE